MIYRVVPYIGTWIETVKSGWLREWKEVVPYIGTWIETKMEDGEKKETSVVPYIGTWIETTLHVLLLMEVKSYLI